MVMMPPVFTYLMASFPAGLVIYWTANNLLSIAQQYVIMRRMNVPIELGKNFKLPAWLTRTTAAKPPDKAPGE
jgi:YidC/Oxa1 family membrane protein insertase